MVITVKDITVKKRLIPFSWWPTAWLLKGRPREEAKAFYYLEGEDLDRRLAVLTCSDPITCELEDKPRLDAMNLRLDVKYGKITTSECEKSIATMNGEPWVDVVSTKYRKELRVNGFSFTLDWNKQFVEMLVQEGYTGYTEDQILEQWFTDITNAVEDEMTEEPADNVLPIRQGSMTKVRRGDGTAEYL